MAATTPEARFAQRVRLALQKYGCAVERIENRVNLGIPDMLVGVGGQFVLLELKALTRGLAVSLRPHQIAFMTRHGRGGRRCFVLVHSAGSSKRPATVSLYAGTQAVELADIGLRAGAVMTWPAAAVDWGQLIELLSAGFAPSKKSIGRDVLPPA